MPHPVTVVVSLALLAACGGATQPHTTFTPQLSVGGTYPTTVALTQSTCPGITVANNTTTVTHVSGSTSITVTHAGNDYAGQVTNQGTFVTQAKTVSGGGEDHTLVITGTFTATGFSAIVAVSVTRPTAPTTCAYTVTWTGTRSNGTNTFP
ncbi:MAG: hypothetical protein ABIY52_16355 [Gemmatimonadaceae bacterium]